MLDQKDAVRVRSCWGGMVAFDAQYFQADPSKVDKAADHATDVYASTSQAPSAAAMTDVNLNWHWTATGIDVQVTPTPTSEPAQDGNLNWHWATTGLDVQVTSLPTPESAQDGNLNWHWATTDVAPTLVPTPTSTNDHRDGNLNWNLATAYPGTSGDFVRSLAQSQLPKRFRAELDPYWDSSECCLIHADIQEPRGEDLSAPTGIYINPFVRVAYDTNTLSWLAFTRRFEFLYPVVHRILNYCIGIPGYNPRRTEEAGQLVTDRVFVHDLEQWNKTGNVTGSFQDVERVALAGGFCGSRMLLALPDDSSGGSWFRTEAPFDEGDPLRLGIPPSVGRLDD